MKLSVSTEDEAGRNIFRTTLELHLPACSVVLGFIDLPAEAILLAIALGLLFVGQIATVLFASVVSLAVELGLFLLQVDCLFGRQRPIFHAVADASLLV